MRIPIEIIETNVATGEQKKYESATRLARSMHMGVGTLYKLCASGAEFNGKTFRYSEKTQERKQRREDEEKFPLVIDSKTTIYVTKDKCNKEYAALWVKRHESRQNRTF